MKLSGRGVAVSLPFSILSSPILDRFISGAQMRHLTPTTSCTAHAHPKGGGRHRCTAESGSRASGEALREGYDCVNEELLSAPERLKETEFEVWCGSAPSPSSTTTARLKTHATYHTTDDRVVVLYVQPML